MPTFENEMEYGCLFCRTGCELSIVREIARQQLGIYAFVPQKTRYRRIGGRMHEEQIILFPGYVFFSAYEDSEAFDLSRLKDVYRLLRDAQGDWRLKGTDRNFIEKLHQNGGLVGLSKAYYEGDRIRIEEGFLKDHEGQIIRVNKRAHTAQVRIKFLDREVYLWLGFELISKA